MGKRRRCVLAGISCLSWDDTQKNVSLFRFPKDPVRRKEWLDICRLEEAKVPPRPTLCSLHFTEKDVFSRGKGYILRKGAFPKVYSKENVFVIRQRPPPLIPMQRPQAQAQVQAQAVAGIPSGLRSISKYPTNLKSRGNQCLISPRQLLKPVVPSSPPPLTLLDGKEIPPSVLESIESIKDSQKVVFHYLSKLSVQPKQNQEAPTLTPVVAPDVAPALAPVLAPTVASATAGSMAATIPATVLERQVKRLMRDLGTATDDKIRLQMENAKLKAELRDVKKDLRNVVENEARLRSKVECTLRHCDEKVKETCRLKAQIRRLQMLADVDFDVERYGKRHLGNVMSVIEIA